MCFMVLKKKKKEKQTLIRENKKKTNERNWTLLNTLYISFTLRVFALRVFTIVR